MRAFRTTLVCLLAALALSPGSILAQQGAQAPAAGPETYNSPVAPQPQIKSQKELEAIQKILQAPDDRSRIKAAEELIQNFADSEFKGFALQMATLSAQQLNDYEQMMVYGERTLEVDPNNFAVMLTMASAMAQRTRKFDLDKEEKLQRATDLVNKAMGILENAPRPNPQVSDQQWEAAKRDFRAQGYEALGLVALAREDYPKAIEWFKKAIDTGVSPNPATKLRLAAAYNMVGNHDEAIATLDDVLADPQLHPQLREIAQNERLRAVQLKELKAKQAQQPAQPPAQQQQQP